MDQAVRAYMVKMGKRGGKRRSEKLSPERRRDIAKLGAEARWRPVPKGKP